MNDVLLAQKVNCVLVPLENFDIAAILIRLARLLDKKSLLVPARGFLGRLFRRLQSSFPASANDLADLGGLIEHACRVTLQPLREVNAQLSLKLPILLVPHQNSSDRLFNPSVVGQL